jgi:hypothetical protein
MDQNNPDKPIGDDPGLTSGTTPNDRPEGERRKRDYDKVEEELAPTRECSSSFSYYHVNTNVKFRRQY